VANSFNTGLLVADPAQYAALAGGTPWPAFPATVLARRSGPVPILFSAGAAPHDDGRAVIGSRQTMDIGGISIPVVLAGTISATPAFPNGGNYIVLPQWAVGQFPSIPGMTTMLATGPGLSAAVMTAAAKTDVPGGTVVIRSQVLHRLRTAASEYAVRLFILSIWIAVGLSLVAMIFGLAATGQSRRHLRTRMAALGMSARQSRALAFTDTIPLLSVAILGMAGAGAALVLISGQVINLGPLTGSAGEVPVTLDWPALAVPAAAAVVLALAGIGFENWRANRAEAATALRTEEAG
jgi:putative ABC transport system permease protein